MRVTIDTRTILIDIISKNAARKILIRNGTLISGFKGSVIRIFVQTVLISAKIMNTIKIARQSNSKIRPAPSKGATAGTIEKIIIINDVIRAISRPE